MTTNSHAYSTSRLLAMMMKFWSLKTKRTKPSTKAMVMTVVVMTRLFCLLTKDLGSQPRLLTMRMAPILSI